MSVYVVCSEVRNHDAIETVISLVNAEQAATVECAITVLMNMSRDDQLCRNIIEFNITPGLVHALSFRSVMSCHDTSCQFFVSSVGCQHQKIGPIHFVIGCDKR